MFYELLDHRCLIVLCLAMLSLCDMIEPGPDYGPSGPWGMKATAGPSYIYLQYWAYFSSIITVTLFA